MIAIDRNPVVTRLIVVSIIVLLLITLSIMGNRDIGRSNINTNETVVTINEEKNNTVRININEASKSALETLPGIGSALANKIIENRPYVSPRDLLEIDGMGETTVQGLLDYIEV